MLDKVQYVEFPKKQDLAEIYQKSGIRFSLASDTKDGTKMCIPWIKCRDFLQDTVRASITNTKMSIYGCAYDSKTQPVVDIKNTKVLAKHLTLDAKDFKTNMLRAKKMLNLYEEYAGLKKKTTVKHVGNNVFLFSGPSFWIKAPALISMYTFLIRLAEYPWVFTDLQSLETAFSKKAIHAGDQDLVYLFYTYSEMAVVVKYASKIFNLNNDIVENYKKFEAEPVSRIHNYGGIVSLCKKMYFDATVSKAYLTAVETEINENTALVEKPIKPDEKNKLIRITDLSATAYDAYEAYTRDTVHFAFTALSKTGERVKPQTFVGCREVLVGAFKHLITGGEFTNYSGKKEITEKIEFKQDKLSLITKIPGLMLDKSKVDKTRIELHKKNFFFAKDLLKIIETEANFDVLTNICSVRLVKLDKREQPCWLFTASPDWIINPVTLTTYCLLLRVFHNIAQYSNEKFKINTVNDIQKFLSFCRNNKVPDYTDLIHVFGNFNKIVLLLKNRKSVFNFKTSLQVNYSATIKRKYDLNIVKHNGINSLLKNTHYNATIKNKFQKLLASAEEK